jgi:anthranilate phosphoribosyltransferase
LLGVFSAEMVPVLADALDRIGLKSGVVVHGCLDENRGVDELTVATRNVVAGFGGLCEHPRVLAPEDAGLAAGSFEDLAGGDLTENLAILDRVLAGTAPSGLIDTILLNAATGLFVVGRVPSIREGIAPARDQLLGGGVARLLEKTRKFYESR